MATRKTGAYELAARCRRVGWTVVQSRSIGGGFKVTCPDKFVVQLHLTPSDTNGHKVAERLLNAHGLAEAEATCEKEQRQIAAEKTQRQREAVQARTAKLATQSKAIRTAAGPYAAPEPIDLEWALAEHPAPSMRWVIIHPEDAKALLGRNTDNRTMKERTTDHYYRVVVAGLWRLTHQGIAMDTRGILQDGQHRLKACVMADEPITCAFFVGMDPDNFKAIDEGALRTASDLLGKLGEVHQPTAAGMARLLIAYRDSNPRFTFRNKTPNQVVVDTFVGEADMLRAAVHWAHSVSQRAKLVKTALAAARFLLFERNGADNPYVAAYLNGLVTGLKGTSRVALDEDDPRLAMRQWVENRREKGMRTSSFDQMSVILLVWNYVVIDHRPRHIRWLDSSPIPQPRLCSPTGEAPSAVPPLLAGEVDTTLALAA
jgi:hypothetical protein